MTYITKVGYSKARVQTSYLVPVAHTPQLASPFSPYFKMSSNGVTNSSKRSVSPISMDELDTRSPKALRASGLSADAPAFTPSTPDSPSGSSSRPVKSLPSKGLLKGAKSYAPAEASVPKTLEQKEATTRLIVVLSKACLEVYRHSSGRKASNGQGGQGQGSTRDALLNCDDHQGFLAREQRDIADARPDITHQVRNSPGTPLPSFPALSSHKLSRSLPPPTPGPTLTNRTLPSSP